MKIDLAQPIPLDSPTGSPEALCKQFFYWIRRNRAESVGKELKWVVGDKKQEASGTVGVADHPHIHGSGG